MSDIVKNTPKAGDRFTAISDLQNNEGRVLFRVGDGKINQKFPEKVYSPRGT